MGRDCLASHIQDSDSTVRAEVEKAIVALGGSSGRPGKSAQGSGGLYIVLKGSPESDGAGADVVRATREEIRQRLTGMGDVVAHDPPDRKRKGYALQTHLSQAPGGALTLNMMCFTFPDQALLGEVSVTASGASPIDLVRAMVPKVLEDASQTCNWSN
jgi:hypothetical protein